MPNLINHGLSKVLKRIKRMKSSKLRSFFGVPITKRLKKERKELIRLIESKTEETMALLKEAEETRNKFLAKQKLITFYGLPQEATGDLSELVDLEQLRMYQAKKNCRTIATYFYTLYKELLPKEELSNLKRIRANYEKLNTREIIDFLENYINPRMELFSKKKAYLKL